MKEVRESVMRARATYMGAHRDFPTLLFASPAWLTHVSLRLADAEGIPPRQIDGLRICGMTIHRVPTLDEGFHIA